MAEGDKMTASTFWNPAREAELRRLAPDYTASQIMRIMGASSRNVIIGKIHRLKLNLNPDKPRGQARPRIERAKPAAFARAKPAVRWKPNAGAAFEGQLIRSGEGDPSVMPDQGRPGAPTEPVQSCSRNPVDIWGLTGTTCRYPLWGDPVPPIREKLYCGNPVVADKLPYCGYHCSVAFGRSAA